MPETRSNDSTGATEFEAALKKAFGDRYELVARLGSGAYGVVFRALDTMLDRDVAIKQVRLDKFQNSDQAEEMKRRTQREAKMAAKLRHPNIVAVYDIVHTDNSTLIIMEFVDGDNLESKLRKRHRLGLEETLELVAQTAGALDHAHAQGVVHRDIKPANLMIDPNGQVKITDFGIAKSHAGTEMTSNITATGTVLGTPYYMSPEQARGETSLDGRSDIFSLGCVTHECLAGQKPFSGKGVVEVLLQIVNAEPAEIDYDALELHPIVETVLGKALSKQTATRYQSGAELVEALRTVPAAEYRGDDFTSPVVTSRERGASTSFDINLQGSLEDKGLAEVLHDIHDAKGTGILHLQRDDISKRLYFLDGALVFANSDLESDRLGQFLIDGGILDKETYERATRMMKKTRRRLGKTLVALGNLDEAKMDALVNNQIQHIIYSVFSWESGHYGFETIAKPVEDDIVVELSTDEIILEGVRRVATESTVRNAIGSMDRILCHSEAFDAGNVALTSSEGFVLSRVDGDTSVAEIAAISPLGEDETLRCIYGLLSAGVLRLEDPKGRSTTRARKVHEQKHETPTPSVGPAPPEPVQSETEAICDEIAAKHASLEGANYYEILDASRGATPDAIKRAYYALAKKYHPDRHGREEFQGVQSQLEEILGRLSDAYEVLSSPPERLRYDNKLPRPEPTSAPEPVSEEKSDSTSDADEAETKPAVETTPTVETSPEVIAEAKYRSGLGYFKDKDYHEAVVNLREAIRLAPSKPAYHKALGHALAKNPRWQHKAETHFQIVLDANPFDLDCYLALAEMYEVGGLATRAREMYEKAIAIDPDHEVANAKLHAGNQPSRTFFQKLMGRVDGTG